MVFIKHLLSATMNQVPVVGSGDTKTKRTGLCLRGNSTLGVGIGGNTLCTQIQIQSDLGTRAGVQLKISKKDLYEGRAPRKLKRV